MYFGRTTIYLVLEAFRANLLAQNQSYNALTCLFTLAYNVSMLLSDINRVVSLANDNIFPTHELSMSFT